MQLKATLRHLLAAPALLAFLLFAALGSAQQTLPRPIGHPIIPTAGSGGSTGQSSTARVAVLTGTIVVPATSRADSSDLGKKAHTNVRFINPGFANPMEAPPFSNYAYETPTSLACVYHMVATVPVGCNPNTVTTVNTGGSQRIAIVDAFDDPEAAPDLAYFSAQFGLPFSVSKFQVVWVNGIQPDIDFSGGWELEESLDIEYAHAMAPSASIFLVEAQTNSFNDLFDAVVEATNIIQCNNFTTIPGACGSSPTGKGEVSMSWGGDEFNSAVCGGGLCETDFDSKFNQKNVVFLASTGDAPGTSYPAVSPNVVAVGGTSISRSSSSGNYQREDSWSDGGGGLSLYEKIPSYQTAIPAVSAIAGTHRATPDVSAVANPYTGVWVYDSMPTDFFFYPSSWWIVGGTSVSAPLWAGVINKAGGFAASTSTELTTIYNNLLSSSAYAANYHDSNYGDCDHYMSAHGATGYDVCTGLGSPLGIAGK
jgi:kumamolisin